tara:strand:- start:5030 stop:6952 length:1923 start_codon:yes stop_codon:yes gene_type:complete
MASNTLKKNPRNVDSPLYKTLTRLFSGPLVNYQSQQQRRYRRSQLNKYGSKFRSLSGMQFKKSTYNVYDGLRIKYLSEQNRAERYVDFDQMEYTPEIASSLDIYADEMTTFSDLQTLLRIVCHNDEIRNILHTLLYQVLNIEFNLYGWSRSMCKFGDYFLYLDVDEKLGIKSVLSLPGNEIERMEGEDKTNPNYIQYQWNSGGMTFENWQIAHFRILGNDKYAPYGTSVLEPARRIWRQLTLLEDAMMSYRVVRSPERRVFYIDVGNIAPADVEQFMEKVKTQMKRNTVVDADSGRADLRYNPMSVDEDYFVPMRGGSTTRVESLPGGQFTGDIDDVEYLRDKLFSALKVPRSYLARGKDADEDKTTLAQKDIRFARTVQRLQRSVVSEIEKVCLVHLYILGYRGDDLLSFKLKLNNPSKIAELQELEHWDKKFTVAANATEGYVSRQWVAKNLFNMTDDEFVRNEQEMFYDAKFNAAIEAAGEVSEGGAGGDMDLGDEEGELDLGGEEGELELGGEEEEETNLLAEPGEEELTEVDEDTIHYTFKDGATTTNKSNGKMYKPVAVDRRPQGARKRKVASEVDPTLYGGTARATGYKELRALANFTESKTSYEDVEDKILNSNVEIEKLIESLEKVNETKT